MSFDKETRNSLSKMVVACRRLLTEDVTEQLGGWFGMHPDGTCLPIDRLDHLADDEKAAAEALRELQDHFAAGEAGRTDQRRRAAYERLVLEVSSTALNRLAALRLCEERGLVVECVRKGTASDGFRLFERVSGGALGTRHQTYRVFLECLFDELALDLGVLFDRSTPQSVVFPGERCLTDVLVELNKQELSHLWAADETIGWIYQYFNPAEERKAMRDASQAPRNSRELAVRNQFFTPRYVVEFLTDNTLGRLWYEMRKGDTALKEECRYLVRRPNEVFLSAGEDAPAESEADLSQEELLKQPVYIEHRSRKDPRDLRVLDPACGSGHFLLYAFDLMERIYEEAWEDAEGSKSEITGRSLREDVETLDALRRAAPKLIIEHNLHGIDIDPRAVQIAALALWLRAQRTWKILGLGATERPRIDRSNIVTAEPMPGEEDMRREFTAGLKPRVLGQLVDVVFEKMRLAGEAGSLLKIEEEIKDAVAEARRQWLEGPTPEQQLLFSGMVDLRPKQQELRFDVKEITTERFWEQGEDRILGALREYAERAENGRAVRRRLFVEDAARGFAFIDLCRRRYDVVVMNPPFGEPPKTVDALLKRTFSSVPPDLYCWFLSWADDISRQVRGKVGCITNSSFILYTDLMGFRELLVQQKTVGFMLDLGAGVLDAYVSAAAYVFRRGVEAHCGLWVADLRKSEDKERDSRVVVDALNQGVLAPRCSFRKHSVYAQIPGSPICHWAPDSLWACVAGRPLLDREIAEAGVGAAPVADFFRTRWEVPASQLGFGKRWVTLPNGGYFSPYYRDDYLVVDWLDSGKQAKADLNVRYPYLNGNIGLRVQREKWFGSKGIVFGKRTDRFTAQPLCQDSMFSFNGIAAFPRDDAARLWILAFLNSRFAAYYLNLICGLHKNDVYVRRLPAPSLTSGGIEEVNERTRRLLRLQRSAQWVVETSNLFVNPTLTLSRDASLRDSFVDWRKEDRRAEVEFIALRAANDRQFEAALGVDAALAEEIAHDQGPDVGLYADIEDLSAEKVLLGLNTVPERLRDEICRDNSTHVSDVLRVAIHGQCSPLSAACALDGVFAFDADDFRSYVADVPSWCVGSAFGRWDVRIALDPSLARKVPDPFDPLPVCPPGMLTGPDDLPAEPGRIVSEEWLRARSHANRVLLKDTVRNPTIADSAYPLRVSWEGILVDDPGLNGGRAHRNDIVRRVREVIDLLWKDKAHAIEQEACEILGVKDLRDYFRRPTGFFQHHLKRYSKSRRKAPIYWPLSTASGSYTLWLYYHRLTDQALYATVNKYVEPKITEVEHAATRIEKELESTSGREATRLRDRLNEGRTFLSELRDLREELLRIAGFPYKPNLNDGVIINAAPFHELFRLRSWGKDTEEVWKKLEKGDYDWAHLACTLWPGRVREACKRDRSIAIAHGLEDLCEVAPPAAKGGGKKGRKKKEVER